MSRQQLQTRHVKLLLCGAGILALHWPAGARSTTVGTSVPTPPSNDNVVAASGAGGSAGRSDKPRVHPLTYVGSLIEADISSARYTYDEVSGPRTEVTLSNVVVHAGQAPTKSTFSQIGGPLPDGRYMGVVDSVVVLHPGARYILFLHAGDWFFSPVALQLAFRVERLNARDIVFGPEGKPVLRFSKDGVDFGTTKLFADTGNHDPLLSRQRDPILDKMSLPDIAAAMDRSTFVRAAVEALGQVQAPLGIPKSEPRKGQTWNIFRSVPAARQ
jgi:hypothetical protein